MQRIEFNVTTKEQRVIDLTPEEEADAQARTAAEALLPRPKPSSQVLVEQIITDPIALQTLKDALTK